MNKTNFSIYPNGHILTETEVRHMIKPGVKFEILFTDGALISVICNDGIGAFARTVEYEVIDFGASKLTFNKLSISRGHGINIYFECAAYKVQIDGIRQVALNEQFEPPKPTMQKQTQAKLKPNHYTWHPHIECHLVVEEFSYNVATAMAYCWRHLRKGAPIRDLKKAINHLQFEVERLEKLHAERKNKTK